MILITVGSSNYKFTRLFEIVDKLCEKKFLQPKDVFAQTGNTKYLSKYYECVDMLENELFKKKLDESQIIICHAGVGTIINCLQKNKKVIVFPRLKKFNEHVDDHQLEIAELFAKNGYILSANDYEQLLKCLNGIINFSPRKFISNNKQINDLIISYINEN